MGKKDAHGMKIDSMINTKPYEVPLSWLLTLRLAPVLTGIVYCQNVLMFHIKTGEEKKKFAIFY